MLMRRVSNHEADGLSYPSRRRLRPLLKMRLQARPHLLSENNLFRHARPCAGHPCLSGLKQQKAWMAGTSPAMTRDCNNAFVTHVPEWQSGRIVL